MTEHRQRYDDLINAYVRERRETPDRYWRCFLWLATVRPAIWERVAPSVNLQRATVDWPTIRGGYWSHGERLILEVAQALYEGEGRPDLLALTGLDDDLWAEVLHALEMYRGGRR